jgi:hypothetical protein
LHLVGQLAGHFSHEGVAEAVLGEVEVGALPATGEGIGPGGECWRADFAAGIHGDEVHERFARVRCEAGDGDEHLDVRDADRGVDADVAQTSSPGVTSSRKG